VQHVEILQCVEDIVRQLREVNRFRYPLVPQPTRFWLAGLTVFIRLWPSTAIGSAALFIP
jgi:hypothetical protein